MAEYYTKTIITANNIIIETSIGNAQYIEVVARGLDEDLQVATIAQRHKTIASGILPVDPSNYLQTHRIARNAAAPDLVTGV